MKLLISLFLLAIIIIMISLGTQSITAKFNPVIIAEGEKIQLEAEQAKIDAEQARIQQQAEWELQHSERKQVTNEVVQGYKTSIPRVIGIASMVMCILIVIVGVSISKTIYGVGDATVIAAHTAAHQIRLDPRTGQYPLYVPKNVLIDMNTGLALRLDAPNEPDGRMITAANSVRLSGVAVNNTKLRMFGNNNHAGQVVGGAMRPQLSNSLDKGDFETIYGELSSDLPDNFNNCVS